MSSISPAPFEVPKEVAHIQTVLGVGQTAMDIAGNAVPLIEKVAGALPSPVKKTIGISNFYSAGLGLFAIPQIVSDIHKAILAPSVVERVKNICNAVINGGSVLGSANAVIQGLKAVGVIAKDSLGWTAIAFKALYPLQILSVAVDAHTLSETYRDKNEILGKIKQPGKELKGHVEDLTEACKYVMENREKLEKMLLLSKETKIAERAESLMSAITSATEETQPQALKDADAFMHILRRRVHTKFNLEVANLAVKVTGVVVGGVALFTPPNPVTFAIFGLCGLASLTILAFEKLLLNEDPFSEPKDVWHAKWLHRLRENVYAIPDRVEAMVHC